VNNPFDVLITNAGEQGLSLDFNRGFSQADFALRYYLEQLLHQRSGASPPDQRMGTPVSGFFGDGFKVRPATGLQVKLQNGLGFQWSASQVVNGLSHTTIVGATQGISDLAAFKPLVLTTNYPMDTPGELIPLAPAPAAPNARFDLIEVRAAWAAVDVETRNIINAPGRKLDPDAACPKTASWVLNGRQGITTGNASQGTAPINYKVGDAGNPPNIPITSTGYLPLALVYVNNGAVALASDDIIDLRDMLYTHAQGTVSGMIQVNTGALGPPTIVGLKAPPGVEVYAATTAVDGAKVSLFLVGSLRNQILQNTGFVAMSAINGGVAGGDEQMWSVRATQSFSSPAPAGGPRTASGIQNAQKTLIEGANGWPAGSKIAIGSGFRRVDLNIVTLTTGMAGVPSKAAADIGAVVQYNFVTNLGN